ncbi:MAG: alanine racemase [Pseudomonadota bacterium]
MNRVVLNLWALRDNLRILSRWLGDYGARFSVVTKALGGHAEALRALRLLGVNSVADTRVANLRALGEMMPDAEKWMIRPPHLSVADEVVRLAQVSTVTEVATLQALDAAAHAQNLRHGVLIMIEQGDLREGVLAGQLDEIYAAAQALEHLDVVGIGAQMGCLSGAAPSPDQVDQLRLFADYLRMKYKKPLPVLSAGSSATLHLLCEGGLPVGINHFRIGEALFLGTDLVTGGQLPELRSDVLTLEAEICELKEKSLQSSAELGATTPFTSVDAASATPPEVGARGYRALLALGQIDTEVAGLTPLTPDYQIAGASSDITVVNVGAEPGSLKVGDHLRFRTSYSAFARLLSSRYVPTVVEPDLGTFADRLDDADRVDIPPVLSPGGVA